MTGTSTKSLIQAHTDTERRDEDDNDLDIVRAVFHELFQKPPADAAQDEQNGPAAANAA